MKAMLAVALLTGCYTGVDARTGPGRVSGGADGGEDGGSETSDGPERGDEDDGEVPTVVAASGARRLTTVEYVHTIRDLLGVDASAAPAMLPTPDFVPFDNDYTTQTESSALVVGTEALARDIAATVVGDPVRLQGLLGCPSDGPIDAACFETFLRDFGRRALRRPPTDDEVAAWADLCLHEAEAVGRFSVAAETALQLLLQHPEFLYRIDRGEVVDEDAGIVRLADFAVASRLSYLLWGSTPDDELLDLADAGALSSPGDVRAAATFMLEDERALSRIARFHSMWMGYEFTAPGGELGESMQQETMALLERVIFDEQNAWRDLFVAEETFVDEQLAAHYGLPAPQVASGDWVPYGDSGRGGVLSHGTFLSVGKAEGGDTSPTLRGLAIRTKLMCQEIQPPPPGVDDALPPPSTDSPCKIDRAAVHRTEPSCAGCHVLMDGIGFGLESYDDLGRFREHEPGLPECVIEGEGELPGYGTFRGPGELGKLLVETGTLEDCLAQQVYRFAAGRSELDDVDQALLAGVLSRVDVEALRFDELLLEYVSDPAFGYARREEVQ